MKGIIRVRQDKLFDNYKNHGKKWSDCKCGTCIGRKKHSDYEPKGKTLKAKIENSLRGLDWTMEEKTVDGVDYYVYKYDNVKEISNEEKI